MTKFADLHVHTNHSDSTSTPEEVVREAVDKELACIAITDHDAVSGIPPATEASQKYDLEVIPGIELSTDINNKDIHILGYFFDYQKSPLVDKLSLFQNARVTRIEKMLEKLKEFGINNITIDEVCALALSDAVGRPHLAAVLIQKGWVANFHEAFGKYLGEGCPAYVHKFKQTPYEAIDLIRKSGGAAVLAHPMVTNKDELIPSFVEAGLAGLEVYYSDCSNEAIHYYEGIAQKHNLIKTGGSDSHGRIKDNTYVGRRKVPYAVVEQLKERCS